ncbi:MAG: anhydro-N-acetylmuramic acid kinase [Prevotellaceae bacterium]|jgi:anhydro-N-acetylmuramic acid kinase|nr:anhydro-N-acetylmuramic acid kinase [Prevotellaceae bacterium]
MEKYKVIGLMSGTSLDGLDVCYVEFIRHNNRWEYVIETAETFLYPVGIKKGLQEAPDMNAFDFVYFDREYGQYIGQIVKQFIVNNRCFPQFIASHGHTIFHQPDKHLTCQIGNGAFIAAETRLPVICDFRGLDVAFGGQGAPLVPIGDRLLFAGYDYCLNIGGFANISFENEDKRIAYDICPANIVSNYYAQKLERHYDDGGKLASQGIVCKPLLEKLNQLDFYAGKYPKSLGREWVEQTFIPVVESYDIPVQGILSTICEHVAIQITSNVSKGKLLITGGGAHNVYLISRIKYYSDADIIIPDKLTVDFKEALIFAFLGVLYAINQSNCLASVTGAAYDNIGGAMYNPPDRVE